MLATAGVDTGWLTVTLADATAEQPVPELTVTAYTPVAEARIVGDVAPVLHR
jgi:hypothetical protein